MPIVLDSTILIDVLRGRAAAIDFMAVAGRSVGVASVTPVRTEVLGAVRPDEVRRTMTVLGLVSWLDVTVEIADVAAGLRRRHHPSHSGIGIVDYLVAAAAIHVNGRVATLNIRDFPMFLELARPY